jgi:hypothetical protein
MSQKNVNTAAKESKESSLSTDQVLDLFDWIMTVPGLQFPDNFTPPADSEELVAFWDAGPDYLQVWIVSGYPVAAAAPMDGLFITLPGRGVMSQLSMFDAPDMAITPSVPVSDLTAARALPAVVSVPARKVRGQTRQAFIDEFCQTATYLRRSEVFRDFVTLAASELDLVRIHTPESRRAAARLSPAIKRRISTGCIRCFRSWSLRSQKRTRIFWVRFTWSLSWEPMRWGNTSRRIPFHLCWRSWPPVTYWRS